MILDYIHVELLPPYYPNVLLEFEAEAAIPISINNIITSTIAFKNEPVMELV